MKVCPQCGAEYELDQKFCSKDGVTLRNAASSASLEGQVVADRYTILRQLGEGGMGKVYLAEHVRIKRKSAVKVMKAELITDSDAVGRFVREATNASRVDHPNVAAIYDFGETADGLFYLAMEYVDGQPLRSVIENEGALAPLRVASIVMQTAEALTAAHDMGIVHRDLKPDNIMLARNRDDTDRVKVVDFGISKAVRAQDQQVTVSGVIIGTPAYMSPEQISGDPIDGRSDVYALALVAFKMLTGELPFVSETTYELMSSRLTQPPRTLTELRPGVQWPSGLQAVLSKALEISPGKRYGSAVEFARDLAKAIEVRRRSEQATAIIGNDKTELLSPTRVSGEPRMPTPPMPSTIVAGERKRQYIAIGGIAGALALAATIVLFVKGEDLTGSPARSESTPTLAVSDTVARGTGASAEWTGPNGTRPEPKPLDTGTPPGAPVTLLSRSQGSAVDSLAATKVRPAETTAPATRTAAPASAQTTAATGQGTPAATPPVSQPAAPPTVVEQPAGPDPAEVISRLRSMVNAQSPVETDLAAAVRESPRMLAAMRTRGDSISVLFYRAQAFALLGRESDACGVLTRLMTMAKGTPFERAVTSAHEGLACQ